MKFNYFKLTPYKIKSMSTCVLHAYYFLELCILSINYTSVFNKPKEHRVPSPTQSRATSNWFAGNHLTRGMLMTATMIDLAPRGLQAASFHASRRSLRSLTAMFRLTVEGIHVSFVASARLRSLFPFERLPQASELFRLGEWNSRTGQVGLFLRNCTDFEETVASAVSSR